MSSDRRIAVTVPSTCSLVSMKGRVGLIMGKAGQASVLEASEIRNGQQSNLGPLGVGSALQQVVWHYYLIKPYTLNPQPYLNRKPKTKTLNPEFPSLNSKNGVRVNPESGFRD